MDGTATEVELDVARSVAGILAERRVGLAPGAAILDFGCGSGAGVDAYRRAGLDAYGCDVVLERETDRLRRIGDPYRLPFPDASFDCVVSHQVLEHVRDHRLVAGEIARVCRPGAATLHIFPPPWRLVEPHTKVPLAGVVQGRPWLVLWATLGVRNEFQRAWPAGRVAETNRAYLRERTNYVGARRLRDVFAASFDEVEFCEVALLRHSGGRSRALAPIAERVPFAAYAYGAFRLRALFARGPR